MFDFSEQSLHLELYPIGGANREKKFWPLLEKFDNPKFPKDAIPKVYLETGIQICQKLKV